jgi:soluble cytochrome b562
MFAYDAYDDSHIVDFTVEALIDQLHSLASEGRLSEAKEIAQKIKELKKTAA